MSELFKTIPTFIIHLIIIKRNNTTIKSVGGK